MKRVRLTHIWHFLITLMQWASLLSLELIYLVINWFLQKFTPATEIKFSYNVFMETKLIGQQVVRGKFYIALDLL